MHKTYYRLLEKILADPLASLSRQTALTQAEKDLLLKEYA